MSRKPAVAAHAERAMKFCRRALFVSAGGLLVNACLGPCSRSHEEAERPLVSELGVCDPEGNAMLVVRSGQGRAEWLGFTPAGATAWRHPTEQPAVALACAAGQLVLATRSANQWTLDVVDTHSGRSRSHIAITSEQQPEVRVDAEWTWVDGVLYAAEGGQRAERQASVPPRESRESSPFRAALSANATSSGYEVSGPVQSEVRRLGNGGWVSPTGGRNAQMALLDDGLWVVSHEVRSDDSIGGLQLARFDVGTGRRQWSSPIAGSLPVTHAVVDRDHLLVVAGNQLSVVERTTGRTTLTLRATIDRPITWTQVTPAPSTVSSAALLPSPLPAQAGKGLELTAPTRPMFLWSWTVDPEAQAVVDRASLRLVRCQQAMTHDSVPAWAVSGPDAGTSVVTRKYVLRAGTDGGVPRLETAVGTAKADSLDACLSAAFAQPPTPTAPTTEDIPLQLTITAMDNAAATSRRSQPAEPGTSVGLAPSTPPSRPLDGGL